MGDSEAPKAGGPPRFTFAALPKAPELPKPMVLPPPPSMPAPGSGPMSPTAVGSTAAGAGGGVSATLDKRRVPQSKTRSAFELGNSGGSKDQVQRPRISQRPTRVSSHPQLQRQHMFLTVSMEPLSSAVCDVCSQPLLDRPYIMCQRCTTSIHMACSGKQTSNACESLPDQSSFEIVERIDEALKDKVARIEHLTSQIKEENEHQEKRVQVMAINNSPQLMEEHKVHQKRIQTMESELRTLYATTFLEINEMSDELRRFSLFDDDDSSSKKGKGKK